MAPRAVFLRLWLLIMEMNITGYVSYKLLVIFCPAIRIIVCQPSAGHTVLLEPLVYFKFQKPIASKTYSVSLETASKSMS